MRISCKLRDGDNGAFRLTVNVCDKDQESSPLDIVFNKLVANNEVTYKIDYPESIHVASDIILNLILIDNPGPYKGWRDEVKKKVKILDRRADQGNITFTDRKVPWQATGN